MDLQHILEVGKQVLDVGSQILGALVVLSTLVVRLTPSPKDDEKLGRIAALLWKGIDFLPTIGVNPKTQKLKEAYAEALDDLEKKE